jgi:hypothetical protein
VLFGILLCFQSQVHPWPRSVVVGRERSTNLVTSPAIQAMTFILLPPAEVSKLMMPRYPQSIETGKDNIVIHYYNLFMW